MNEISSPITPTAEATGPLLFRVLGAAGLLESSLEQALGDIGLSLGKAGILKALAKCDCTLSDMADQNRCVRSNITQLMDRLEQDGLVRRENDPDDRRVRRASLTAKGRKAYADAVQIIEQHERQLLQTLGAGEAEALERLLGRLNRD
ncbi:MAG TPA: MarR family transcriptional regulator [Gemmatimonadales bacterium]|nr:MarR family transcriptional regulator [Gemmatimonadales bacterium]